MPADTTHTHGEGLCADQPGGRTADGDTVRRLSAPHSSTRSRRRPTRGRRFTRSLTQRSRRVRSCTSNGWRRRTTARPSIATTPRSSPSRSRIRHARRQRPRRCGRLDLRPELHVASGDQRCERGTRQHDRLRPSRPARRRSRRRRNLPTVNAPTTIDASTQPGYAGPPVVTLDGSSDVGRRRYGLLPSGRQHHGPRLRDHRLRRRPASSSTTPTATRSPATTSASTSAGSTRTNNGNGIALVDDSDGNTIGGTGAERPQRDLRQRRVTASSCRTAREVSPDNNTVAGQLHRPQARRHGDRRRHRQHRRRDPHRRGQQHDRRHDRGRAQLHLGERRRRDQHRRREQRRQGQHDRPRLRRHARRQLGRRHRASRRSVRPRPATPSATRAAAATSSRATSATASTSAASR